MTLKETVLDRVSLTLAGEEPRAGRKLDVGLVDLLEVVNGLVQEHCSGSGVAARIETLAQEDAVFGVIKPVRAAPAVAADRA